MFSEIVNNFSFPVLGTLIISLCLVFLSYLWTQKYRKSRKSYNITIKILKLSLNVLFILGQSLTQNKEKTTLKDKKQETSCPYKFSQVESKVSEKSESVYSEKSNIVENSSHEAIEKTNLDENEKELEFKKSQLEHIFKLLKEQELKSSLKSKKSQIDNKYPLGEDGKCKEEQIKSDFQDQLKLYGL
jgi:hypothetical protein